jgi:NADH-quinone oxidoreductase subunit L
MQIVAIIGALTSFFAATVAIVQSDIKRVLAYSTISQIGYMMVGVGVGAFAAGIFHLMTHAFFKGLLFLCAGSVMHALEGEQDMNRMGGLRRKLPITYASMLIAALAISGIPVFAGYFSKDLILESTYTSGHIWLWLLGLVTAGLTSFYMFRLIFVTFHGESRVASEKEHHIHESPPVMTIPLIVLAVFSIIGGWVELPEGMMWGGAFSRFLAPVVAGPVTGLMARPAAMAGSNLSPSLVLSAVATLTAIIGIGIAWIFYIQVPGLAGRFAESMRALYNVLRRKYYIDELYHLIVTRPLFFISTYVLFRGVDVMAIDGIADGLGLRVEESGEAVRKVESGNVQHYAFVYLLGALAVAAYYVYLVIR